MASCVCKVTRVRGTPCVYCNFSRNVYKAHLDLGGIRRERAAMRSCASQTHAGQAFKGEGRDPNQAKV